MKNQICLLYIKRISIKIYTFLDFSRCSFYIKQALNRKLLSLNRQINLYLYCTIRIVFKNNIKREYKVKMKLKTIIISTIFLTFLIIWIWWGNTALQLNSYIISSDNIPDVFNGYRIAHLSDIHNTEIGKNNEFLISTLLYADPDIIVITGDFIDARKTNIDVALKFAEQAMKIAPCYYIPGNHESRISVFEDFKDRLKNLQVVILENKSCKLEAGGEYISLLGVADPSFKKNSTYSNKDIISTELEKLIKDTAEYTILLSHRPELFDVYVTKGINLVLSGHAHGGQFRIPFIGGLIAPNQGIFPKYDAGLYIEKNTNMIVSRGIGNSSFPFRINNRPEVVLIELKNN